MGTQQTECWVKSNLLTVSGDPSHGPYSNFQIFYWNGKISSMILTLRPWLQSKSFQTEKPIQNPLYLPYPPSSRN